MVIIPHRSFSQLISTKELQDNGDMANLPRWVCLPGQRTEMLKDVVLILGGWNLAFTWRKPLLSCYLRTAKELMNKLQQHHSLILNETESACSDPVSPYVELFGCRPGSSGRSQALVTTSVHLRPYRKLNHQQQKVMEVLTDTTLFNLCWTGVLLYS